MTKNSERTLVLLKPDALERGLVGELISRFERVGLKIVAMELIEVTDQMGEAHYPSSHEWLRTVGNRSLKECREHNILPQEQFGSNDPIVIGRIVKKWNIDYLKRGPVIALVLVGNNAVTIVRKMIGATVPKEALPGTIRGDYSIDSSLVANVNKRSILNIIHASGSVEEADDEITLWFSAGEVFDFRIRYISSQ